jgi:hydroxymethylbilane synthase
MRERVRVGTRRSRLATLQTGSVVAALSSRYPGIAFEVVPVDTSGDRDRTPGGSPDFTDAIDRALRRGTVDLGVHSAKDLPVRLDARLRLAACPRRANPREALVRSGRALPRGARVGSSSLRRRAQLLRWRPDLKVVEVRGNVDTRLALVGTRSVDAVVLAVAGLVRLGRTAEISETLPLRSFLPAPGQGALALVTRREDRTTAALAASVDDRATRASVAAEREFAAELGGDCRMPLAALAHLDRSRLVLTGEVLTPDGDRRLRGRRSGTIARPAELGRGLGAFFRDQGAIDLLRSAAREDR